MHTRRWHDVLALTLGLYLLIVPGLTANTTDWATIFVAEVAGTVVALLAIWALERPGDTAAEWAQAAAGVGLIAAPFAFGYVEYVGATWNAVGVGAAVLVLALAALPAASRVGFVDLPLTSDLLRARARL